MIVCRCERKCKKLLCENDDGSPDVCDDGIRNFEPEVEMKNCKTLVMLIVFALVATSAFAAGGQESGGDGPLTLFHTGDDGNALQLAADRYLEETGNEVEVIQIPYDTHRERVIGMIRANQAPALLKTTDPSAFADFARPLDDVIAISRLPNATSGYWRYEGQIISLPVTATANGMWINKTLFDQAGVAYPTSEDEVWTWEEFTDAIVSVKENTGVLYALGWDVSPHRFSTLLYQFGGSIFVEDEEEAAINQSEAVDALEYFVRLHEEEVLSRAFWIGGENPRNAFMSGQMVAHLAGSWMIKEYYNIESFEAAATYMPIAETRSSVLGGNYLMIMEGSGMEEEAVEFMEWFTEDEQFATYVGQVPTISPLTDVEGNFENQVIQTWMNTFQDELEVTSTAAGYDWASVDGKVRGAMMPIYIDSIVAAVNGDMTPQEAFDVTADAIADAFED